MEIINDGDNIVCKRNYISEFIPGRSYVMKNYYNEHFLLLGEKYLCSIHMNDIWEYFYTKKEVRRLKLKKINGRAR